VNEAVVQNKLSILIVDDVKDNLLALSSLLARSDVTIFQALSGNEALELLMEHEFCLAMVDVQMPEMSGFELAELMRGSNRTKNVPIIFVTATEKDRRFSFKGYESGAVDFLLKPLDTHAVKSKVSIFIELFRHKEDQEKLLAALKKTQAELEQEVRARDEFMSIASHELKTPLSTLKLQAQMMKRKIQKGDSDAFAPENVNKLVDQTEKQVVRLERLVDDMLDITRIRTGKLTLQMAETDLCEVTKDVMERLRPQMIAAGTPPTFECAEKIKGTWDRMRLEQVVTNLLTNAMKYGNKQPVSVKLHTSGGRATLSVQDHGIGIQKDAQAVIFDCFERAISAHEISGLGLGLFISQEIVKSHGGKLWVESEIAQGSTFFVELPLTD